MRIAASVLLACAIGLPVGTTGAQEKIETAGDLAYFSSYAKHLTVDVAAMEKRYFSALNEDNDGVVESALAHITRLKLYVPCATCDELHQRIHSLAVAGRTPSVRLRAYLADQVLDSPELFVSEQKREYKDAEEMFSALSARLQSLAAELWRAKIS